MRAEKFDDETDMVDAFVACGGMVDKSGHVKRDTLVSSCIYIHLSCVMRDNSFMMIAYHNSSFPCSNQNNDTARHSLHTS
jgi:hypothetical protein